MATIDATNYALLSGDTALELTQKVTSYIGEGYSILDGTTIVFATFPPGTVPKLRFYQAVVKIRVDEPS